MVVWADDQSYGRGVGRIVGYLLILVLGMVLGAVGICLYFEIRYGGRWYDEG